LLRRTLNIASANINRSNREDHERDEQRKSAAAFIFRACASWPNLRMRPAFALTVAETACYKARLLHAPSNSTAAAQKARAGCSVQHHPGNEMADLKAKFDKASEDIKQLKERPDNDMLLKLYALYKQGSDGDVTGPKPGFFDFVGTAKYEAWAKLKGTKSEDAMQKYVDLVKKLGA
jgi:acyl-CoA-binding protein